MRTPAEKLLAKLDFDRGRITYAEYYKRIVVLLVCLAVVVLLVCLAVASAETSGEDMAETLGERMAKTLRGCMFACTDACFFLYGAAHSKCWNTCIDDYCARADYPPASAMDVHSQWCTIE